MTLCLSASSPRSSLLFPSPSPPPPGRGKIMNEKSEQALRIFTRLRSECQIKDLRLRTQNENEHEHEEFGCGVRSGQGNHVPLNCDASPNLSSSDLRPLPSLLGVSSVIPLVGSGSLRTRLSSSSPLNPAARAQKGLKAAAIPQVNRTTAKISKIEQERTPFR